MTTSGSTDFSLTVSEIITEAYQLIRVGADGESLTADQTTSARRTLNLMVKSWQADGLRLWTKTEGVLFLDTDTRKYSLGSGGTAKAALESDVVQTALSADAISGATTITVDSISGIAASDVIGVELSDGTLFWTTVSGAPSGVTITLASGLSGAASDDGVVYTYTAVLEMPLRVLDARRRVGTATSFTDTPLIMLERPDYFWQSNKASSGPTTQFYYDRQLNTGYIYLWPQPSDEAETVRFTFERHIEDLDSLANTQDLPQEWLEVLIWNLAARLSFKTSFPIDERTLLIAAADSMKSRLDGWDRESGSVFFAPGNE